MSNKEIKMSEETKNKDIYFAKATHEFAEILNDLGTRLSPIERRALMKASAELVAAGMRIGIQTYREVEKETETK